jgi:PIN domain nuclease of toxin-antitoxin system
MSPLLDTHAWIWWLQGDEGLTSRERSSLDDLPRDLRTCIADISLWEVAALCEKARFTVPIPFQLWIERVAHPATVRILPITPAIVAQFTLLRSRRQDYRCHRARVRIAATNERPKDSRGKNRAGLETMTIWSGPPFQRILWIGARCSACGGVTSEGQRGGAATKLSSVSAWA